MAENTTQTGGTSGLAEALNLHKQAGTQKRRRRLLRWSIGLLLIVALLVAGGLHGNPSTISYKTQSAQRGDITIKVTATGNLQPTNQVVIGSELSGTVKFVAVDYNDRVTVGQLLARLDTSKLSAQVAQSQASLDSARAKVLEAKATIKETKAAFQHMQEVSRLSHNKAVSKSDIESAEAALERAQANYASALADVSLAEATLKLNQTDLAKTEIRSPINGIVLTRSIDPGQTVAASLAAPELFTLAEDLTQMELQVDVDEADVGKVKDGQSATFTVDAYPDRSYPAEITQVRYGATTTSGVVTYETLLKADNADLSLRPGMTVTADITVTSVVDALLVPNAALRFSPQETDAASSAKGRGLLSKLMPRPHQRTEKKKKEIVGGTNTTQEVWILSADHNLVPVSVKIGLTNGFFTQIIDGEIQPGMELVTDEERVAQ